MSDGHVFAIRADLTHLACDDIVVPTDRFLNISDHWLEVLGGRRPQRDDLDVERDVWEKRRFARFTRVPDDGPRVWLVDTGGTGTEPVGWYTDALCNVLEATAALGDAPRHRRERRLTAMPLVGVGQGWMKDNHGDVITGVLDLLDERAADGQDTALVLWTARDHAAVQHVRRLRNQMLPEETQEATANSLANRARRRELALFLGAGVSASAGLPLWGPLLESLLSQAGVGAKETEAIAKLDARDAATLAVRRLGGTSKLPEALRAILTQHRYGLAHALLAALPVDQTVTTNYDRLFETTRQDQGRPVAVLPFETPKQEWLLKVHGDLDHDDGIVLTREDYLRFGERSGALAGVVQGMLMTKHVLFAGFSFTDENLFRMAHATKQALESAGRPRSMGTALELRGDQVKQSLWEGELDYLSMGGPDTATAARKLEIFLDRVAQLSIDDESFLLDPAYDSLKSNFDLQVAGELLALAERMEDVGMAHGRVDELLRSLGWRN
ncbi:SIR2 family protein [Actinomycetospora atypica]|uniref:SIR2 family protein n=1 Tax=Actinomycetospora atypica TaxID=1290095 RepID=A0ABV9YHN9_9PSEU